MKMQRFSVTFEATMDVVVYAPEGTTREQIQEIASGIAESPSIKGWEMPEFEAFVGTQVGVDIPDEERGRQPPNKYGFRKVADGPLSGDAVVLSDEGDDLVCIEDATWWEAKETP